MPKWGSPVRPNLLTAGGLFRRCAATVMRLRPLSQNASRQPLLLPARDRQKGTRSVRSLRRGFTLAELLVVIAIVSLLAAILFPVFATAREKGRQTVCAASLKQLALAWQMYAQDYDERACPSYLFPGPGFNLEQGWDFTLGPLAGQVGPGLLAPYEPSRELYQCPDFLGTGFGRPYTGYAYNATYLGGDDLRDSAVAKMYPACELSQIAFPAQTAAFADGGWGTTIAKAENYLRAPSDTAYLSAGLVDFRHSAHANIAYADGHVHASPDAFPFNSLYPEFGTLSADDSAYGPSMRPASAYAR